MENFYCEICETLTPIEEYIYISIMCCDNCGNDDPDTFYEDLENDFTLPGGYYYV